MTMRMRAPLAVEREAKLQACPVCGETGHCNPDYLPAEFKSREEALKAGADLKRVRVFNGVVLDGWTHLARMRGKIMEPDDGSQVR